MCNLYSITTNQAAIIALFRVVNRYVGNLAPMAGVFPDYKAPIVRSGVEGRELATARWGMPSSSKALMDATKKRAEKLQAKGNPVDFKELLRMEPDGGTTNLRNVKSKHWTRWLGVENRCVVPFNSFSEFNKAEGGDIWFAFDDTRPLACFAGIWTNWTSVRKVKEGETTNDLYAFLTTEPNAEVGPIHPKAMPVILTSTDEVETWMTAPADEALKLQRPLPDGSLRIVARGVKEDPASAGLSDMNTFVSDPDREARANSVKNAVAICRMEGGEPSEYCLEQLALFEAGHISATEMRDRVVRHAQEGCKD
jgi:putative SOS response-associated peptidase YedK